MTTAGWSPRRAAALCERLIGRKARTAIGAAAVAIGTTAVAVLLSGPGAEQVAVAEAPLTAPSLPADLDAWTTAAHADLQATQFQLAEVARGVGAWSGVPQTGRTPAVAADYSELQSAEGNLRQQQDLLTNELTVADRDRRTAAALTTALARLATAGPAEAVRGDCLRLEHDFTTVNDQVRVFVGRALPDPGDVSTANLADVIVQASMTPNAAGTGSDTAPTSSARKAASAPSSTASEPSWPAQINQVAPLINQLLGH